MRYLSVKFYNIVNIPISSIEYKEFYSKIHVRNTWKNNIELRTITM